MGKIVKIGIVGLGRAGLGMHCEELVGREDKYKIVAVCDLIEARRDKAQKRFGCKTYENIQDLIDDPEVELVDIATRSKDHYNHTLLALGAGKDVFLEKPMCLTYEEALGLKEAGAKKDGPNLYIRHNRRFEFGFMRIMEIIKSGILGNIFEVKMNRFGFGRRDDWQTIIEHGGGQLLNWGPHIIDQSLRFLGGSYKNIDCYLKNMVAVGDAEDHVKIIFTGHSGMTVDMTISGCVAIDAPEYLVYGDRGSLTLTKDKLEIRYLNPKTELPPLEADPGTPQKGFGLPSTLDWLETVEIIEDSENITMIWDELYKALTTSEPFSVDIDEALAVMEVIDKLKNSCEIITINR